MNRFHLACLLVSLQLICIQSVQLSQAPESKTAFVVFDESNEEFVIVNHEPPRDKYVAGAKFTNAINQTGYVKVLFIYWDACYFCYIIVGGLILKSGPMEISRILFNLRQPVSLKVILPMSSYISPT